MDNLIAIQNGSIGGATVQTVNARGLHAFLEVGKDFSSWIKKRIEQYGFIDGVDYVLTQTGENPIGGRPAIEYHITIAMGKELAMVERNAKGKEARLYFIECEKRALAPLQIETPEMQMARGLIAAQLMIDEKTMQIEQRDKMLAVTVPKAAALDRLATADGLLNLTQAAKVLDIPPRKFNQQLHTNGWIYRMGVTGPWTGTAQKLKAGYLSHKIHPYQHKDGTDDVSAQVFVTPKGMTRLASLLGAGASA